MPIIGPIIAGIVGLIPNCAGSVILTQLYLENVISIGSMIRRLISRFRNWNIDIN